MTRTFGHGGTLERSAYQHGPMAVGLASELLLLVVRCTCSYMLRVWWQVAVATDTNKDAALEVGLNAR